MREAARQFTSRANGSSDPDGHPDDWVHDAIADSCAFVTAASTRDLVESHLGAVRCGGLVKDFDLRARNAHARAEEAGSSAPCLRNALGAVLLLGPTQRHPRPSPRPQDGPRMPLDDPPAGRPPGALRPPALRAHSDLCIIRLKRG
jgi:hypothetical protein